MEKIEQKHREKAAEELSVYTDAKTKAVVIRILAGKADDHPSVQAAAFYEDKGN